MTDLPGVVTIPPSHMKACFDALSEDGHSFTLRATHCDQGAVLHIQDKDPDVAQFMVGPVPPLVLAKELEKLAEQLRDLGGEKHPRGIERGRWIMGQLIGVARVAASQMEEAGAAIKDNSFQVLRDHTDKAYDWVAEGFTGPSESSEHEEAGDDR